ncbi:MAG TPA: 6-phosphogluconolactonase [Candidatus Limnocylindria bacterium]|nr:6-phosphogluconolactonase [Candidatus Limnocylindria bacterium]
MHPELMVFGAADWPEQIALRLAKRLRRQPRLRLCLPTGDTPSPVYERLVGLSRDGLAPFGQATIVLLDEYVGLPPTDPARCDARLARELIDRLDPPPAAYHPIAVDELSPAAAAHAHDAVAAEGLDLAVLGLGLNGHVGFNEPGSGADSPTRVVDLAPESRAAATARYGARAAPRRGVTLGLARLLAADELWLLVSGAGKSAVLKRVLEEVESADCPARFLRRHPKLHVLADEDAAMPAGLA